MKIVSIIIGLLCFFSAKAQDLNKIKSQNVYFIYFNDSYLSKKHDVSRKDDLRFNYYYYRDNKEIFNFSFHYSKYPTFDDAHNDLNVAMVYKLNRSFFKKNKDIIITREFMEKIGENNIVNLLYGSNKYIFLIDESETNDKTILLRQVRFNYILDSPEPVMIKLEDVKN